MSVDLRPMDPLDRALWHLELIAYLRQAAQYLPGSLVSRYMLEAAERLEAQEGALLRARVGSAEAARQMVRVGL